MFWAKDGKVPGPVHLMELAQAWRRNQAAAGPAIVLAEALTRDAERGRVEFRAVGEELCEAALVRFGHDGAILVVCARLAMHLGRFPLAHELAVQGSKILPSNPEAFLTLGQALLRVGDAMRAERAFERALALGADRATAGVWAQRAKTLLPMQARGGTEEVAAEVARLVAVLASDDGDGATRVGDAEAFHADSPSDVSQGELGAATRMYDTANMVQPPKRTNRDLDEATRVGSPLDLALMRQAEARMTGQDFQDDEATAERLGSDPVIVDESSEGEMQTIMREPPPAPEPPLVRQPPLMAQAPSARPPVDRTMVMSPAVARSVVSTVPLPTRSAPQQRSHPPSRMTKNELLDDVRPQAAPAIPSRTPARGKKAAKPSKGPSARRSAPAGTVKREKESKQARWLFAITILCIVWGAFAILYLLLSR